MKIAVIIPCYNEELTIGIVLQELQKYLPEAKLYVCDNASEDNTLAIAKKHGAIVFCEPQKGKGHAIRRLLRECDADIYVMIDGDHTYHVADAQKMITKLITENLDMVGARRITNIAQTYRPGHEFGNYLLSKTVKIIFGNRIDDLLSGYRVMSRRLVKSFPVMSTGFEIETELSVHALALNMPIAEIDSVLTKRPEGSFSKLNTYRDGLRILWMIITLFRNERPLLFFSLFSGISAIISFGLGIPLIFDFLETSLVKRQPTAILSVGFGIISALFFFTGLFLDTITHTRRDIQKLFYLSIAPISHK